MKILVTGARGFVGRNLIAELRNRDYGDIEMLGRSHGTDDLRRVTKDVDFVFNLAGENRSDSEDDFSKNNSYFVEQLFNALHENGNEKARVLISSLIQATRDNIYGRSKKKGEEIALRKGEEYGNEVLIYAPTQPVWQVEEAEL